MNKYIYLLLLVLSVSCVDVNTLSKPTKNGNNTNISKNSNQLINESSPYLLQHANNPVNWYPWGEKALKKAKDEDKMLIISVGYSACHWCHVMEHESFEDTAVANLMNEHFISIKVDREERPDVDNVYMTACHLASGGSCGWPLNALALPTGEPFWAGTYFPKKDWKEVLTYFVKLRKENPQKLKAYAGQITDGIKTSNEMSQVSAKGDFSTENLKPVFDYFDKAIDYEKGGKKSKMKFPMPNNWAYLLEYYFASKNKKALDGVTSTLDNMARGGIYDQIGGGFSRYSTDEDWRIPHFEKMLYDNGQLVSLYSSAFQLTKKPLYKNVVYETLGFIEREMMSEEGAFYSSLDADSEGEEGKFYAWTYEEIAEAINDDAQIELFAYYYDISTKGNWEATGKSVPYIAQTYGEVAKKYNTSLEKAKEELGFARAKVLVSREKRVHPALDNKVLTAWNAIMLKGYIDAYRVFGEEHFLEVAIKNANFIAEKATQKDFRLTRNYKDGKASINGFLDDYALVIESFIDLYQATFDEKWLLKAQSYANYAIKHFYDKNEHIFYYTSSIDAPLIVRKKEISDNVIPSSNSIMAKNLYKLGTFFFEDEYITKSKQMLQKVSPQIFTTSEPYFFSNWLSVYLMLAQPPYEVAIVGKRYKTLRKELDMNYLPNAFLLGGEEEGQLLLLDGKAVKGETIIYVCQDKMCKSPVNTVKDALKFLEK